MNFTDWLPVITTGILVAFGAAIWAFVRSFLLKMNSSVEKFFGKMDSTTEKWMGDENSDEMWKVIADFGRVITEQAESMIQRDSFRKSEAEPGDAARDVVNLSKSIDRKLGQD